MTVICGRASLCVALLAAACAPPAGAQQRRPPDVSVEAAGRAALLGDLAAAEDEAIWDAKRNAVEEAAGVMVRAEMVSRNQRAVSDSIAASTQGFIRRWSVVGGSEKVQRVGGASLLTLRIRAVVGTLPPAGDAEDAASVYADMDRPHICVTEFRPAGLPPTGASLALTEQLRALGFQVSSDPSAEVHMLLRVDVRPTVQLGDSNSPYGVGKQLAASVCTASLRCISTASDEVLAASCRSGAAQSFVSDNDAAQRAVRQAVEALVQAQGGLADQLLRHWVEERERGHSVVIEARSLTASRTRLLVRGLRSMRDTFDVTSARERGQVEEIRLRTLLPAALVRQRLSGGGCGPPLRILQEQGSRFLCSAPAPRPSRIRRAMASYHALRSTRRKRANARRALS